MTDPDPGEAADAAEPPDRALADGPPAHAPTDGDVYCPLVTPFDADGAVAHGPLADLVDRLVDRGIDGLVPCGTAGEFAALTDAERTAVVETTVAAADGRVPVVAGASGTATEDVRRRLDAVDGAGADAALLVAPYYGGQAAPEGNAAFFRAALSDAPLPAYLYNIPHAAGQHLDPATVAELADRDAVVGLKDTSGDLTTVDAVRRRTPADFALLQGHDAQFVPALAMGADGAVSALSHLVPETFAAAAAAVERGDLARARELQLRRIDPAFERCAEHGFAPAIKAVLDERDQLPTDVVRPPQRSLSDDDRQAVLAAADGAAVDDS